MLLVGWYEGHLVCNNLEWWGAGMVIRLVQTCMWPSRWHCHSLSLASVKSRLVLPFWYRLAWVKPLIKQACIIITTVIIIIIIIDLQS